MYKFILYHKNVKQTFSLLLINAWLNLEATFYWNILSFNIEILFSFPITGVKLRLVLDLNRSAFQRIARNAENISYIVKHCEK